MFLRYDIRVKPKTFFLLTLLALPLGCETREVTNDSYTGLRPTPTRVEKTKSQRLREQQKKDDDGFLGLFGKSDKKPRTTTGVSIATPTGGQKVLPRNYTGETAFANEQGQKFKLRYDKGTLVGIEPEAGPTAPPPAPRAEDPAPEPPVEAE